MKRLVCLCYKVAVCISLASFAQFALAGANLELAEKVFQYHYENGQQYRIKFDLDTLTWKGIAGDDSESETDVYQSEKVSDQIYFINWTENDGTYVSVVMNLSDKTVFSSGSSRGGNWFNKGAVKID